MVLGAIPFGVVESLDEAANGSLPYGEARPGRSLHPTLAPGSAADQLLRSGGPSSRSQAPSDALEAVHMLVGCLAGVCLHEDALSAS